MPPGRGLEAILSVAGRFDGVGCLKTLIAIAGQSVLDRTTWPDGRREDRLGGAAVFAAQALARQDSAAAVVLTQGGDDALRRPLTATGLEVIAGGSPRTTTYDVRLHGDGTWEESMSAIGDPFTPRDVATWMSVALARCSAVVCGSLWYGDFPPNTLAALGQNRTLYFDGQGLARPRRLGQVVLQGPLDRDAITGVRVLKLSEDEALALIGGIDAVAAAATGIPIVVVTLGERGAVILSEGIATAVSVAPVDLADTVGAGDAFLALMAAAETDGAAPLDAVGRACDGVAALLRSRLEAEVTAEPAQTGVA
jgi:fructokinase